MVGSVRQGWAIFAAMAILWVGGIAVAYHAEQHGTPAQHLAGVTTRHMAGSTGGNMEGKEQRNGIVQSALWADTTTVTSNGSVNASMESLTGLGSAAPMSNLGMSEVVFGGVGTGLYSMLVFVLLAVFIGGLMVGRTPEYLGKKISAREIKLISLAALATPLGVLMTSGSAIASPAGRASLAAGGPQGFSENLYAYLSQGNNNGSAFAGYTGYIQPNPGNVGAHGVKLADLMGGLTMIFLRFLPIILVLAIAGRAEREEGRSRRSGDDAHRQPDLRRAADRRDRPRRRPHLLPRAAARPNRAGADHPALLMRRDVLTSVIAIVALTLVFGVAYPLVTTGVSQVIFPGKANGSKVHVNGKLVGSKLIGQDFRVQATGKNGKPLTDKDGNPIMVPVKRYFQERPSTASSYAADASAFTNLGPNSADARDTFKANLGVLPPARAAVQSGPDRP